MYAPSALVSGKFVHSAEYMKLALNPGGVSGGTCFGDSGGPDLLGGTDTVLAVNSYVTNINCSGVGYSSRVDIPEVLEWINSLEPEMVLDGYSSGPYNGTTLTVDVTVYEHPNGSYIGLGEYTYGTVSWPLTVADACVNETAKTATAWGPADAGYYGMLSLHDAGTGMMARAGHRGTMTELQPYIDTQCGGTPLFPATGTGVSRFRIAQHRSTQKVGRPGGRPTFVRSSSTAWRSPYLLLLASAAPDHTATMPTLCPKSIAEQRELRPAIRLVEEASLPTDALWQGSVWPPVGRVPSARVQGRCPPRFSQSTCRLPPCSLGRSVR